MFTILNSCNNDDQLLGKDIRLFKGKPWKLAKAVEREDTVTIRRIISEGEIPIDFQEPKFGNTLLMWTVMNQKINSFKCLLQFGADPNLQDHYDGTSTLMYAADIWAKDTIYLKLCLQYGGDPNAVEQGVRRPGNMTRNTPLILAATHSLAKVKMLVNTGADINYTNEFNGNALFEACVAQESEIVRYLLIGKKADFSLVKSDRIDGSVALITDWLRHWVFPLDSKEYKIKMEIVAYLKERGLDYWKTEIPHEVQQQFPKEYVEKY